MELDHPQTERSLARSSNDRVLAGVCAGLGHHLGVDPIVVRLAVVVLALVNGVGVVAYLLAWAVLPAEEPVAAEHPAEGAPQRRPKRLEPAMGVALITLGVLLLSDELGMLLPKGVVWAAALAAAGLGLVWARTSESDRDRWRQLTDRSGEHGGGRAVVVRIAAGSALLVVGLALLLASNEVTAAVGVLGLAMVATGVGVALLLGPWIVRLLRDLGHERRERIRSEERSEMAAHLHDSVLQTLALIQRHADAPARARTLARRQERELRAWLFDDRAPQEGAPTTLTAALDAVATEVEDRHEVEVAVVVVGDCPLDSRLGALVRALREAAFNAARHAAVAEVSVYVEVEADAVRAYVRDRGRGFDLDAVEPGRLGLAESIIGRMARHGGRAEVHSAPGEGTEVVLEMDRVAARSGDPVDEAAT